MFKPNIAYLSKIDFEFKSTKQKIQLLGKYTHISDIHKINKIKAKQFNILVISPDFTNYFDTKILSYFTNVKYITTVTSGYEYIDLNYTKKVGITVSNVVGANSQSVAEHAWGMLLSLSKKITQFDRDVRNKNEYKYDNYTGLEVSDKTIGIFGYGQIGSKVAHIAKAFNMNILVCSKSIKKVPGIKFVSFDILLKNSDYIVICTPLTDKTNNIFNDQAFNRIKKECILVNISRDEIVNVDSVCKALKNKKLFGFGLDGTVYSKINPKLLKFNNVIANAHNGFNTVEANKRVEDYAVENINAYIKRNPIRVVN